MGVLEPARWWISAVDLPDVSNCFRRIGSASERHATLHGVVFDILVGSEHRVGLAAVFPDTDHRMARLAVVGGRSDGRRGGQMLPLGDPVRNPAR